MPFIFKSFNTTANTPATVTVPTATGSNTLVGLFFSDFAPTVVSPVSALVLSALLLAFVEVFVSSLYLKTYSSYMPF